MTGDVLLGVVIGAQDWAAKYASRRLRSSPNASAPMVPCERIRGAAEVTATRTVKADVVVVRFKGIDDRSAAEALAGTKAFRIAGNVAADGAGRILSR